MEEFQNDKLVFYFEEVGYQNVDMQVFVVFDDYEQEYYVTGLRNSHKINFNQFKFYCKTKKQLCAYLLSIIDENNTINYTLYNYPNLYDYENIDYYVLNDGIEKENEIVGYDNVEYGEFTKILETMLCNLKNVRY
jgi:hypothetical protein